eukprot:Em0001g384a
MLSELVQSDHDDSAGDAPTTLVNENASDPGSDDEINTAGGVAAVDSCSPRTTQHRGPSNTLPRVTQLVTATLVSLRMKSCTPLLAMAMTTMTT